MVSSNLVDWQKVTFEDAFTDITSKATKVDQSEFLHSGKYPIVDQGQNFIAGYTDDEELVWGDDLPVVIFGDHTRILKYVDFPFVLGADGTKVLKPNKDILPLFAYYQILSFDIPSAGYSRHFKFLKDYKFQYPSMDEQKRIASLLARADRLRQLRRTAHDLGDALLQSVFLEMFGDPSVNDRGWKVRTLRSVSSKFSDGPFGSDLKSEHYVSEGVRVIRLQNIGVGNLIDDDKAYITEEHFAELSKHQCLPGDVIVGTLGDPNLRAIILPPSIPQALNKADCVQIRVNPKICNNQFVCWLLNMPQTLQLASGMIHGQTRARINMGRLAELEVPIPPLSLQEEFAGVVARVESLRGRMGESARQVEGLFESLLAESFS